MTYSGAVPASALLDPGLGHHRLRRAARLLVQDGKKKFQVKLLMEGTDSATSISWVVLRHPTGDQYVKTENRKVAVVDTDRIYCEE